MILSRHSRYGLLLGLVVTAGAAVPTPHPDAVPNTHAPGEVDNPAMVLCQTLVMSLGYRTPAGGLPGKTA